MQNNYQSVPFPRHDINPSLKDDKWIMQAAKAAWGEKDGQGMFYNAREKYAELRAYALGKQSIENLKPLLGVDKTSDSSPLSIDWSVWPVVSKYRDIIVSLIMNVGRKAIATPIDALAKDKADEYFDEVRVKILMRDALKQVNPELSQAHFLQPNPGEPKDMRELEMQMNFGFKFNMAMEAEQGIALVQYQNNLPQKREQVCKDIFDIGVGAYKDWLDDNGKAKFRDCDPAMMIVSNCTKSDFSDKIYCGEVIEPTIAELSQHFNSDQLKEIEGVAHHRNVYTESQYSRNNDKLKVAVLDIEILTWNDLPFSRKINAYGNKEYKKTSYENIVNPARKAEVVVIDGEAKSKYFSKKTKCWYKISWVIGTDFYYNCGKLENQKVPKEDLSESESSFHVKAVNFNKMTALGMMERLKPIVNEYQLTIYKIQDFKNRWLPYFVEIDIGALQSVALGAGGSRWTEEKILELLYNSRTLIVDKKDISVVNVNYKAVEVHQTGMAAELAPLMNDVGRLLQAMNDVTGLNPVTDGTGAGERKLKSVAQYDAQATNNALQPMMFAEKMLFESLSRGCILRLIQAVKMGKVEGVMTALGGNTVKFIKVSPDISLCAWGIKVQDIPTDDDVQMLMQQMGLGQSKDLFRPQDIFIIKSMDNIKQMEQMIGYLYEERVKEQQAYEMQKIQQASKGNQETVLVSEKAKQETLMLEYKLKTESEIAIEKERRETLRLKLQADVINNNRLADAKLASADIAGQHSVNKQYVANEKSEHSKE